MPRPIRDISQDFWLIDGLTSATLKVDGKEDVELEDCVFSNPSATMRELDPSLGYVTRRGQAFSWPMSESDEPPLGSIIVDAAGKYWTVWHSDATAYMKAYELFCLNLAIASEDFNEATVLKATYGKGAANEAVATWHGFISGKRNTTNEDTVLARFQPSNETAVLMFGADWAEETYRVTLSKEAPINVAGGDYRLIDSNGRRYRVVRYFQAERLDRLPVAIAVLIKEGSEGIDE